MKKLLLVGLVTILTSTGCQRLSSFLAKPQTEAQAVTVPAHLTNIIMSVPQPAQVTVVTQQVAGQTFYVTNTVQLPPVILTNTVLVPSHTETQQVVVGYAANPSVLEKIAQAQGWNSLANPTPTAPIVNIALAALGAALTGFAGWKTKQLQTQPKVDALQSMIKSVETFVPMPPSLAGVMTVEQPSISDQLKAHISTTASLDRTEAALSKEVKAITNA